jgi:hypothetical protein
MFSRPTIGLDLLPSVEDDNVTVVTSNVTQIVFICYMCLSIAAIARHLLGNPSPQYLNVITIATNQASCRHWCDVHLHHRWCGC